MSQIRPPDGDSNHVCPRCQHDIQLADPFATILAGDSDGSLTEYQCLNCDFVWSEVDP